MFLRLERLVMTCSCLATNADYVARNYQQKEWWHLTSSSAKGESMENIRQKIIKVMIHEEENTANNSSCETFLGELPPDC